MSAKRAAPTGGNDETPTTLKAMLLEIKDEIAETVGARVTTSIATLSASFKQRCDAIQESVDEVRTRTEGVTAELRQVTTQQAGLADRVTSLEQGAAQQAAGCSGSSSRYGAAFGQRGPYDSDNIVLRINGSTLVTHNALLTKLRDIAREARMATDSFQLRGPGLGRRFTMAFQGSPREAADKAKAFNDSLRSSEGVWREVSVDNPLGGQCRVYIGHDKCRAALQRERLLRDLSRAFAAKCPALSFDTARRDGILAWRWRPFCVVSYDEAADKATATWNHDVLSDMQADPVSVLPPASRSGAARSASPVRQTPPSRCRAARSASPRAGGQQG